MPGLAQQILGFQWLKVLQRVSKRYSKGPFKMCVLKRYSKGPFNGILKVCPSRYSKGPFKGFAVEAGEGS